MCAIHMIYPYLEIAIDVIYNDLFTGINQLNVT